MKMEERERIIRDEGKQIGIINGKIESVLELLEDKGEVPEKVKAEIFAETDPEVLKKWLRLAAKSETIEEFCKEIIKWNCKMHNIRPVKYSHFARRFCMR